METVAYFPQMSFEFSSVREAKLSRRESPNKIRRPEIPTLNILEFLMRIA